MCCGLVAPHDQEDAERDEARVKCDEEEPVDEDGGEQLRPPDLVREGPGEQVVQYFEDEIFGPLPEESEVDHGGEEDAGIGARKSRKREEISALSKAVADSKRLLSRLRSVSEAEEKIASKAASLKSFVRQTQVPRS